MTTATDVRRSTLAAAVPPPGLAHVLHLEDCLPDADLIGEMLRAEWPECRITRAGDRLSFESALAGGGYDLILSDFSLPNFNGLAALEMVRNQRVDTPFIFISGTIGEERAIEALKAGAVDYVIKDQPARLVSSVHRALEDHRQEKWRRAARQRLREQAALLDRARDAIIATDLDHRVTFWNASAERLYGWTAAEAAGVALPTLLPRCDQTRFHDACIRVRATGEWRGRFPVITRDGQTHHIESHWTLVPDEAGRPASILTIDTDVTEEQRLETQLLRSQRMESLGLLAGGVAHDLNNVLAPIQIGVDLLRTNATDASMQRVLRSMQASARHGTDLVRQLIAFARGGAAERAELTLAPLVADVRELLAPALPRSIEVATECASDLPAVLADGTQLKQILLNLCLNARDAMPHGGHLTLTATHATAAELVPHRAAGPHVRLSITDTGTGMPPEVLAKIFEPFFTTKEAGKGTGLGLATVRNLVQRHDGVIAVDSAVDRGTTFHIYLPVPPPRALDDPACHCEVCAPRGHGELIVVVDDNETMRTALCSTLEHSGYRAHPVADGGAALDWFQQHRGEAAVALVDLVMPGIDGSALLGVLPALDSAVRVVALRHADDPPAAGTAHHLTKPIQPGALLQLVRRLIDGT